MATDIAVLQTTQIAESALEKLNSDELPDRFMRDYSAKAVTSDVLELTVHAKSEQDAIARAQALLDVFIADRVRRAKGAADAQTEAVLNSRADVQRRLDELGPPTTTGPDQQARNEQRDLLTRQVQALEQQLVAASAGASQVAAGTQVVDPPHAVPRSLLSTSLLNLAIGLLVGLGVGLAISAVLTVVRDRPVLRRDIAAHLGASVIAQLADRRPLLRRRRSKERVDVERKRLAATISRVLRDSTAGVSILELGCARLVAALAIDIAAELSSTWQVLLVDDLPGREVSHLVETSDQEIEVLDAADYPPAQPTPLSNHRLCLGVGSVRPGAAWTDLKRLGGETVLIVRAGHADAYWLHTVARQLADCGIPVIGVVLVHPDPRDRSDGTLWDGLHTALRGRVSSTISGAGEVVPSHPEGANGSDGAHANGATDLGGTNGRQADPPSVISAEPADNREGL